MDKKRIVRMKLIAAIIGALGGFLYWRFVGCQSGTCPIQSVWYYTTLWGMVMGYLIGSMVVDWVVKRKRKDNEQEV